MIFVIILMGLAILALIRTLEAKVLKYEEKDPRIVNSHDYKILNPDVLVTGIRRGHK